jgi:cytochrome c
MKLLFRVLTILICLNSTSVKAGCDAETGRKQFNQCIACHSVESGVQMTGPSLHGLFGRKAGSLDGFVFSPALETSEVTWSKATLSLFLEQPMTYIPGSVMPFGGIRKAEQRAALTCYLEQFSESASQENSK